MATNLTRNTSFSITCLDSNWQSHKFEATRSSDFRGVKTSGTQNQRAIDWEKRDGKNVERHKPLIHVGRRTDSPSNKSQVDAGLILLSLVAEVRCVVRAGTSRGILSHGDRWSSPGSWHHFLPLEDTPHSGMLRRRHWSEVKAGPSAHTPLTKHPPTKPKIVTGALSKVRC